jgi:putative hydrolase of the HAD superfamily
MTRSRLNARTQFWQAPIFPFDVILFDVGGVLLTNGWDHRERAAVLEQFHLDLAEFEARHAEPYDAWERGAISLESYLDATVFYEPRSFSRDEFFAAMLRPIQAAAGWRAGNPCGACRIRISAAGRTEQRGAGDQRVPLRAFWAARTLQGGAEFLLSGAAQAGAGDLPAGAGYSGQAGGADLFIDDRAENVAGAAAAGMKAIRFEGAEALRRELASLGVL